MPLYLPKSIWVYRELWTPSQVRQFVVSYIHLVGRLQARHTILEYALNQYRDNSGRTYLFQVQFLLHVFPFASESGANVGLFSPPVSNAEYSNTNKSFQRLV